MEIEIINAIKNKNLIEIYYEDELQIVAPYCYGISETGADSIIAFSITDSQNRETQDWNYYEVDKASDLNVLVKTFENVASNHATTKKMIKVYASL